MQSWLKQWLLPVSPFVSLFLEIRFMHLIQVHTGHKYVSNAPDGSHMRLASGIFISDYKWWSVGVGQNSFCMITDTVTESWTAFGWLTTSAAESCWPRRQSWLPWRYWPSTAVGSLQWGQGILRQLGSQQDCTRQPRWSSYGSSSLFVLRGPWLLPRQSSCPVGIEL